MVTRSRFVTNTGLSFAVVAGGMVAVSVLQLLLLLVSFPPRPGGVRERMAGRFAEAPWALNFVATHPVSWVLLVTVVSSITLVAALALLRRKNWGRRLFIAVLGVFLAWIAVALPSLLAMRPEDFAIRGSVPQGFYYPFLLIRAFTIGIGLLVVVVCIMIIVRLRTPSTRSEFDNGG